MYSGCRPLRSMISRKLGKVLERGSDGPFLSGCFLLERRLYLITSSGITEFRFGEDEALSVDRGVW